MRRPKYLPITEIFQIDCLFENRFVKWKHKRIQSGIHVKYDDACNELIICKLTMK